MKVYEELKELWMFNSSIEDNLSKLYQRKIIQVDKEWIKLLFKNNCGQNASKFSTYYFLLNWSKILDAESIFNLERLLGKVFPWRFSTMLRTTIALPLSS